MRKEFWSQVRLRPCRNYQIGNCHALRKFESAGVIESRSSGMKGTYIKVINDYVFTELDRIKAERTK